MAITLRDIKKNLAAEKEKIRRKVEDLNNSQNRAKDDRFWNLETDQNGTGSAIIRFLRARADEDTPFVTLYNYGFQGPTGKWYIENSLKTIGKTDPVDEANAKLWQAGDDASVSQARKRARRTGYVSNILVISDPKNPENEGKVKLFRYGKKLMAKIKDMIEPPFEGDPSIDPFCFFEGANFRLKVRRVEGYPNYDASHFDKPSELFDGDEKKIEEVWNSQHPLMELLDEKHFKSYDELKKRFVEVMGEDDAGTPAPSSAASTRRSNRKVEEEEEGEGIPFDTEEEEKPKTTRARAKTTSKPKIEEEEDEFAALVDRD